MVKSRTPLMGEEYDQAALVAKQSAIVARDYAIRTGDHVRRDGRSKMFTQNVLLEALANYWSRSPEGRFRSGRRGKPGRPRAAARAKDRAREYSRSYRQRRRSKALASAPAA